MSFKTPILCDRRVYAFKGKWRNPQNDIDENIFYFVKEPLTLVSSYDRGREQFKETITICVFGNKVSIIESKSYPLTLLIALSANIGSPLIVLIYFLLYVPIILP